MNENQTPHVIFIVIREEEERVLWEGSLIAIPSIGDYVKLSSKILPYPQKVIQITWHLVVGSEDSKNTPTLAFVYVYLEEMNAV